MAMFEAGYKTGFFDGAPNAADGGKEKQPAQAGEGGTEMEKIKRSLDTPNEIIVEIKTYDNAWEIAQEIIKRIREANINCELRVEVKDVFD